MKKCVRGGMGIALLALCQCSGPLVIAHRGASAFLPEHTIEAYELAIQQGADFIEPDLVVTRDRVLVARHENEITETTDVAVKFPTRKRTQTIEGKVRTGWFIEDFTWQEVQSLRAIQRLPFRDQSHNGKYRIPSFEQILGLVGDRVGVYPEVKQPEYFQSLGLDPTGLLLSTLGRKSYKVFIQCFSEAYLKKLRSQTRFPLVYLIDDDDTDVRTLTSERLKQIHGFADVVGLSKAFLIQDPKVVERAHSEGLKVHLWTMRDEERYVPKQFNGSVLREAAYYHKLGVDGAFWDSPETGVKVRR